MDRVLDRVPCPSPLLRSCCVVLASAPADKELQAPRRMLEPKQAALPSSWGARSFNCGMKQLRAVRVSEASVTPVFKSGVVFGIVARRPPAQLLAAQRSHLKELSETMRGCYRCDCSGSPDDSGNARRVQKLAAAGGLVPFTRGRSPFSGNQQNSVGELQGFRSRGAYYGSLLDMGP